LTWNHGLRRRQDTQAQAETSMPASPKHFIIWTWTKIPNLPFHLAWFS